MPTRDDLRAAYLAACEAEIEALKPGNVHRFADGHRMNAAQFLDSARVSAGPLTDPALGLGARMLAAVAATRAAVGTNTNLGIVLLCGPLLRAAEAGGDLRANLRHVLAAIDAADTTAVFAAIAHAAPGGLGEAEAHDVRAPPDAPLLDAMASAANRDLIARQYVTGFADVFDTGVVALDQARARGETGMWPAIRAYLAFLAGFPDSHVARKHGDALARAVQAEAKAVRAALDTAGGEVARIARLLALDASLKDRGINPGTSADLTVASLLVQGLDARLRKR